MEVMHANILGSGKPLLILHGSEDISVPPEQAHLLAEASGTPARILAGLGHSDLLERPELHWELIGFLEGLRRHAPPSQQPSSP